MNRNKSTLEHILTYCNNVNNSIHRFGDDYSVFVSDCDFQRSVCMSLFQMGELTVRLSDGFKTETNEYIDWRNLKGLRNIVAHRYGSIQLDIIWEICKKEIPKIKAFCEQQIKHYDLLNEESIEPDYENDLER